MIKKQILLYSLISLMIMTFSNLFAGSPEEDIEIAYRNAMKGVYWAFENVPVKKETLSKDLIVDNKNICSVKISIEVKGFKVTATGYYNSSSVEVTTYKSFPDDKK